MKKVLLYGAIAMATMLVSCDGRNGVKEPKVLKLSAAEKELVTNCNDFSFNLLAQVANTEDQENVILSPLSASVLLGMVMNGADGETLAQIRDVLGFADDASIEEINAYYRQLMDALPALDKYSKVALANGIWVREDFPVRETFVSACKDNFDAEAKNVKSFTDQKVLDEINRFAAQHTNKRIKEIVTRDMVNEQTIMALLNAVYFKAQWEKSFKKSDTKRKTFTTLNGQEIQTDMMYQSEDIKYGEDEDYQIVELPYKGGKYCADIVLPAQGIDIRTWAKGLTAERWSQMVPTYSEEVELTIPKFSLNYERELKKDLQALGMTDAFDAEWKANFTRMVEPNLGGLYVWLDMVKQKAFMQVDEEGTEAAAVTVGLMKCYATAAGHQFIADRPYLFVIREKDYGTILFAAIIGHPEWQK